MKRIFAWMRGNVLGRTPVSVKAIGAIFVLTLLSYSNMFHNPFFMDDFDFIVDWPLIQDWSNWPRFFIGYVPPAGQEGIFSPLKTLIHAVNYHLFGPDPFGHHVFAFMGYLFGLVMVYKISFFFLQDHRATFLGTLLFALHPVHIEYVSSMTGGVDAVGIVLLFASFYFYVHVYDGHGRFRRFIYGGSLLFAFLSIYLHELCITLPVMFLWHDFCWRRGKLSCKELALRVGPFFAFSISYVLAKYVTLGAITRGHYIYDSFYLTMLVAIKAMAKYVYISFFPVTLTFNHVISKGIYSFEQKDFDRHAVLFQSFLDPQVLMSLGVLGVLAYIALKSYKNEPLVTFCIGWFFIGLLPGANIVPSGVYFAERYLYAGSLGFCLLFGYYMNRFFQADKRFWGLKCSVLAMFMTIFIVIFCGVRIWIRNGDGRSEVALYESAVRTNPHSALMRTDMGIVYARYGLEEKALNSLQEAIKIRPDDPVPYFVMADVYRQIRQYEQAVEALRMTISLDPAHAGAYYNLAGIYAFLGKRPEARENLEKALYYYQIQGSPEEARELEQAFWDYFGPLKGAP